MEVLVLEEEVKEEMLGDFCTGKEVSRSIQLFKLTSAGFCVLFLEHA